MAKKKKSSKPDQKLSQRYYNPRQPGSFGGVQALKRATGIQRNKVQTFLSHQDTYTLHKPVRRKFQRRRIIVGGIDQQWQADLIDVSKLKKDNDGYTFLLTVIDVFSKYAWVVPLSNKTGATIIRAFELIFTQGGRKPLRLQTDKGSEFLNRPFQNFLQKEGVEFFVTQNEDIKAAIVERYNRTLKEKLWRYFTHKNTLRYVEVLPHLVRAYNQSYHRSIKRAPVDVTTDNQEDVWQTLYADPVKKTSKQRLKPGDRVRISKARRHFRKAYQEGWTEELFTVSRILKTSPITYRLKDDHGEELTGTFYAQEIQKVGDKTVYRVESVLDRRKPLNGQREVLVKWFGYPDSFNSWIPERHLQQYTG